VALAVMVDGECVRDGHPVIHANGENRAMRVALVVLALLAAAPAQAGVRVVPPFDPAEYADRAAIGLLVPGAGPTVTREAALAALLQGELEHGLLGGITDGENRIELGEAGGPEILVSLPPPGRSDNDVRYPIALLGERGLLTSDSTRIDGLVSVTDIATGRLHVAANHDPAQALETLDDRIERNSEWRLSLTIALAALLLALALLRPQHALRALLVVLAANLWLSPFLAVAAGLAVLLLPLGWACAAILGAYLVSMGLDAETVALSPFGPSQSGRFYGINNLLETMLLAPALVGAALLGRAGIIVAALAFVTIGGNRFGADGGGIVVLAAAYLVLWLRLRGERLTWRLAGLGGAAAVTLALALLGLDATTGGSSHVTDAVGDGPAALAGDIADRIELSIRRTAASAGAVAVVLGSLAILVAVALRARRSPVLDAFLVAIAVSLVVNDTPGDILGMGAAIAVALARYTPEHGWLSSQPMRRAAVLLALLALSGGLAGCGGGEEVSPTPETIEGTLPEVTTSEEPGSTVEGDASNGAKIFASAGCGGCHTLEAAGSSGNVGPNLDQSQPDLALTVDRVTNGQGAMPSFGDSLSEQEIADVAQYVVESTS
jgi:mono/diheme cytochrome c family protein